MTTPIISLTAARALHLAAQGLLSPLKRQAKPDDVVSAIQRMGLLQIDTISVVARSPYLVLFSRLGAYQSEWLEQALAGRKLFEYWAHEACFLPIDDFGLLRHRMLAPHDMGWKYSADWVQQHQAAMDSLLRHIEQQGPVRSADFSAEKKGNSGWWDWKPEKRHLEILFTAGKLMVAERRNFHRVYDLTERLLPAWDDARHTLPAEQARRQMLRRTCRYLGIFRAEWLADYYRLKRVAPKALLAELQEQGEITPVQVEGLEGPFYVHESLAELLPLAEQGKLKSTVTSLLSPLTRWYGIGAGRWSCSTLTIGWSVIRRKKNAAMGTSPCRCCTAVSWWGALTPRRTVARGCSRSSVSMRSRRCASANSGRRISGRPSRVRPNGTVRNASRWATFRRRWPLNGGPAGKWDNERRRRWVKRSSAPLVTKGLSG